MQPLPYRDANLNKHAIQELGLEAVMHPRYPPANDDPPYTYLLSTAKSSPLPKGEFLKLVFLFYFITILLHILVRYILY
ncbi:Hypothetical predicted protein [Octopus vulgaris]|uniref:Uncharacterized protein n=1 Tax=Octopus vulgaris TaxID=6645 RepID=A0AA36BF18_OCTVU|nr:Hypothetical predicted protein [Octopus vulgaris]